MSFVDTLVEEVQASDKLDAGSKAAVKDFLLAQRAVLEQVGGDVSHEFLQALNLGGETQAWDTLVAHLGEEELLALLVKTETDMGAQVDVRAKALAAYRQFADTLGTAALRALTRVVLAAI